MSPQRVLLTGPSGRTALFARAAEEAGWVAIEQPLLGIEPVPFEPPSERPDWLVLTSASALTSLASHAQALRGVRSACVGRRSAEGLAALGLAPEIEPAPHAEALLAQLVPRLAPKTRVLWPRGQRSKALARDLVRAGARVLAPLAYRSVALRAEHALPEAEAVLLASPSCVELWTAMRPPGKAPWALALGPSSATAARAHAGAFRSPILVLPAPTPDALGALLQELQP